MSDNQLTSRDFELEVRADRESDATHAALIAQLHKTHNDALDRLAESGHKLPYTDRLAQGRIAILAALDLLGYQAITQEAYDRAEKLYRNLLAEQDASVSTSARSS